MAIRLFFFLMTLQIYSQVGIQTTNPQQKLHLGSTTGTVRVESLNHINSIYNGGDADNDGDLTDNTYPLYVDHLGNLTLEFIPLYNSNGTDAIDDSMVPVNSATLLPTDTDGQGDVQITLFNVTVNRAAILEVKYNLSYYVYRDSSKNIITDNNSRRISTYFTVSSAGPRKYGPVSRCYTSGSSESPAGPLYNASTAYIQLPAAGTYDIQFYGEVSSNTKGSGAGPNSLPTFVEFASGHDSIFLKLH